MPDRMPNRMSEDMSDRMPEDVPVRTCINVMVGITRSKVIFLYFLVSVRIDFTRIQFQIVRYLTGVFPCIPSKFDGIAFYLMIN